ncbi:MAG TPA: prepilin-type N-terminal cleavage/methylation domain-containing protein [Phycisphaerae bacterium]|nr:prepilin-type N-terminal cleavage/methylation domain-containing protein [Phycisphaerae bacterium]
MMLHRKGAHRPVDSRRGFSLIEATMAMLLVAILLVAALSTLSAATTTSRISAERATGLLLAQDLMAEITCAAYVEPAQAPSFGPEGGEADGTRSAFDDVDDYHNWDASPPERRDGTAIPDRTTWRRSVQVRYVNPNNLPQTVATNMGAKRITVVVTRSGKPVALLTGVRTDG